MIVVDATLSQNRKFAICGGCGKSLCRRDRLELRTFEGTTVQHMLTWDVDWRVVPTTPTMPEHIERSEGGLDRLYRGRPPIRRGFDPGERPPDSRDFPEQDLALCPWATCGALNRIDRKRLDVAT